MALDILDRLNDWKESVFNSSKPTELGKVTGLISEKDREKISTVFKSDLKTNTSSSQKSSSQNQNQDTSQGQNQGPVIYGIEVKNSNPVIYVIIAAVLIIVILMVFLIFKKKK